MVPVRLCNETITAFRARVDPATGDNVWTPTMIAGASWWSTDASTVDASKGGLVAAGKVIVRIPVQAAPEGFDAQPGDILVRSDASAIEAPTPAALKQAYGRDCATALGVTDNRRAPNAPHWRITAGG